MFRLLIIIINSSLPARNLNEMSDDCRNRLFNYTNPQVALDAINEDAVLSQLKRLKKNRSPGVDGFTIEHLISLMLGGNRDAQLRSELIKARVYNVFKKALDGVFNATSITTISCY